MPLTAAAGIRERQKDAPRPPKRPTPRKGRGPDNASREGFFAGTKDGMLEAGGATARMTIDEHRRMLARNA